MLVDFLKYGKVYFVLGGVIMLSSIAALVIWGINPGIDFTGGSILELEYLNSRASNEEIEQKLTDLNLESFLVQSAGEKSVIIRTQYISEETHQKIIGILGENQSIAERRFESIGPVIGQELKQKTFTLIFVSLLAIVFYITLAFRKIKRPISGWQYGIVSLFALFHDVLIPIGVFSLLGKFYNVQVTIPVIVAFLTIVGYSINNVVVVFDRIRENLIKRTTAIFAETVNLSLNQTLTRCISTSLTTLLVLVSVFFFGGETLKYFALALIIGIIAGMISAVFLAGSILVFWSDRKKLS
ncbi:MAG: protein translocase subunit SecF [Candidatus Nealsonbacteria bacterium]